MNWRRPLGQWVLNRGQSVTTCEPAGQVRVPLTCANCEEPSTQVVRCTLRSSSLLIPYCTRCYKTLEAAKTRVTMVVCASLLAGIAVLLLVPLLAWDVSRGVYALVVLCVSGLPLMVGTLLRPRLAEGQTSADVAVWSSSSALVGTNAQWMERLGRDNDAHVTARRGKTNLWAWPTASGALLLSFGALALYELFYPTVVVLNLSVGEFEFWVDGRHKATVGVSSLESQQAAREITLPVGPHRFEAKLTADGEVLESADVDVDALGLYLFAPGAVGHCFWTESVGYGKNQSPSEKRRLGGKDGFIVLPQRIDTWFAPNPPINDDRRSSGGEMVALRHGLCSEQAKN